MDLQFVSQIPEFQLNNPLVFRNVFEQCAKIESKRIKKIVYNFVSESEILDINKNFLKHEYITDIITFDNSFLEVIEGEIFICIQEVERNSVLHGESNFDRELNRVILHGLLHLMGYTDGTEEEKKIMRERESFYLQYF